MRWALGSLTLAVLALAPIGSARDDAAFESNQRDWTTEQGTIAPAKPSTEPLTKSARAEGRRLYERLLALRRAEVARATARSQEPTPVRELPADNAEPQAEGRFHGTPSGFVNVFEENTLADDAGKASQVAEPSAANEGRYVMMAGNFYRSRSVDGGATWTNIP